MNSQFVVSKTVLLSILDLFTKQLAGFQLPKYYAIFKISGNQISCFFFLKRARLVESYEGSGLKSSYASLGLFIAWMYLDGALCLPCLCFGMDCEKNGNKLNKLFKSLLTFWTTTCSRFQSHSVGNTDTSHCNAVIAMEDFMADMTRRAVPINQQMDQSMQQQINKNCEKMKSIIKTVFFCGQSNISLRGRRDDNPDDTSV